MKISTYFSAFALLLMAGCSKDAQTTTQVTVSMTSERSVLMADQTFDALNGLTDSYFVMNGLKSSTTSCPLITATLTATYPIVVNLDWGTGCTGDDGILRSGKISVSLSGMMNMPGAAATFSFTDFVSDGNKITGTHKVTYVGLNANNNWPRFSVLTEVKIAFPDQKFMTYHAEYVRLLSEGSATLTMADDVWRIEGASSGITREGLAWTAGYPSAVVKKMSCKWFSSGSILITPEGQSARTINFGDGTCDDKATLTIGSVTTDITL